MRGAFWAVWLLAGCRTTHTLEASQQADTELHREVQSGPEHIVMTVEEFSLLCDPKDGAATLHAGESAGVLPAASGAPLRPEEGARLTLGSAAPSQPTSPYLIRRTVTVTDRGPSLETLNELSRTQAKVNEASKSAPGGIFALWPLLLTLIPVAIGLLRPAWLGIAWGALKGLFGRKVS